jgi:hypothetical protein
MSEDGEFRVSFQYPGQERPEDAIPISEERQAQFAQIIRDTESDDEERAERIKAWAFAIWATNLLPPD